jgi:hypothetical protein
MVRAASLPAWAALFVEGARLLRESGYFPSPPEAPVCEGPAPAPECPLCPACAPNLACPEPRCETSCPAVESASTALVLGAATLAVAVSQAVSTVVARRGDGRARTAPARRGGGVVDEA